MVTDRPNCEAPDRSMILADLIALTMFWRAQGLP